jgi:hypothetical protein
LKDQSLLGSVRFLHRPFRGWRQSESPGSLALAEYSEARCLESPLLLDSANVFSMKAPALMPEVKRAAYKQ